MLKEFRRPTPALVLSLIALFVALGGSVYAAGRAHKVNGKTIKVKSIPGNRLKPDTVTGAQVNESTLAQVPSATAAATATSAKTADTATSATTATRATVANNAEKVNGHTATCVSGTQFFAGACWESSPRAAAGVITASETCNNLGGSLPNVYELVSFSKKVTLGTTDEWSNAINEVKSANTYTAVIVSKTGVVNLDAPTDAKEYRCVFPLVR